MLLRTIAAVSAVLTAVLFMCCDLAVWLIPVMLAGFFLGLLLAAFLILCAFTAAVDMDKPREEDSRLYRAVMNLYIEALIPLVGLKIETAGLEKTPGEGRFLLVCNHQNDSDPGILMHFFRNSQLAFISKRENRSLFVVGKFMHMTLCQLVNRENDREALKCILKCIEILKNDRASVAVFPEGYESLDGRLLPFRAGVFKIAQKAQVPIVVCTLQETERVIANLKKFKPLPKVKLHLLEVIPAEELKG